MYSDSWFGRPLDIRARKLKPFNQFKWREKEINILLLVRATALVLVLIPLEAVLLVVVVIPLTVIIAITLLVTIVHRIREVEGEFSHFCFSH